MVTRRQLLLIEDDSVKQVIEYTLGNENEHREARDSEGTLCRSDVTNQQPDAMSYPTSPHKLFRLAPLFGARVKEHPLPAIARLRSLRAKHDEKAPRSPDEQGKNGQKGSQGSTHQVADRVAVVVPRYDFAGASATYPAETTRTSAGVILALRRCVKTTLTVATLALAMISSSCGESDEFDTIDGGFSQALTSLEEDGVLRFVNDCPTSLAVLDDDAALDARAATRIVSHRDGVDATCGTSDDQLFASMAELDDVPWVGDSALSKLLAHATSLGYVTDDGAGVAGEYDNVPFSLAEAKGVLAIANGASQEILDIDIGLDARAAQAIMLARPFDASSLGTNMQELAAASYVGTSALQRLKNFVAPWESCSADSATVKGTLFSSLEAHDTLDMLNQAPQGILTSITGIGPVIADRINFARPFETLSQLASVAGVGPSVATNIHEETGRSLVPDQGARCGCAPDTSYRPPYVAFDENGLYYFLAYGERWEAERVVDSGFVSLDGSQVVLTDVQVPQDPDNWQDIATQVFGKLWECCLQYQYTGAPLELRGKLHLGRVRNTHDNKFYVLAYWQDIDDASFGWLYEQDSAGAWVEAGEVYLN